MKITRFASAAALSSLLNAYGASAAVIYDLAEAKSDATAEAAWYVKYVPTAIDAEHLGVTRTSLTDAIAGFQSTSVANASSSNSSDPLAFATSENSEEVKVRLSSAAAGYVEFGGLTSAAVGPDANHGAAEAGNHGSQAGYQFTTSDQQVLTSLGRLRATMPLPTPILSRS